MTAPDNGPYRTGTAYLTVRAGSKLVGPLIIVKSTQAPPQSVPAGHVVVRVTVRIPVAAFKPLEPMNPVVVPESAIRHPTVDTAGALPAAEQENQ